MWRISTELLENKDLFKYLSFKKFRFGEELSSKNLSNTLAVILKGECILSHMGNVSLMTGDFLNLENYFNRDQKNSEIDSKYRVVSAEMEICCLKFGFIEKLPDKFR